VAIAFKQFGNRQAATWIDPFEKAFANCSDVNAYSVIITEGLLFKMLLRSLVVRGTRQQTPPDKHDKTLLYFGNIPDTFQDSLRIHNTMAGYVFLLDGKGRVRFAGSGDASDEEVQRVIAFANTLSKSSSSSTKYASSRHTGTMGTRR
jgi:ATPase complex subunit ATP10